MNSNDYCYKFTAHDIETSIKNLNPYCGLDDICSQHFKYGSDALKNLITIFVNCCLQHSFIPHDIASGVISPIIKDKLNDNSKVENYRPIIKSSVFLKLFESLILSRIMKYLRINDQQHGFRSNHSTLTACFSLKETVFYYLKNSTPVYAAFLDFSKAFD